MYQQQKAVDDIYTKNYGMKLNLDNYYSIALPSIIMFIIGLFILRSKLQSIMLSRVPNFAFVPSFKVVIFICILLRIVFSDTIFVIYLVAQFRYPMALYLYFQVSKRHLWLIFLIVGVDLYLSLQTTMFQNIIIWTIFLIMKYVQVNNFSMFRKAILFICMVSSIVYIQKTKVDTRAKWSNAYSEEIDFEDELFSSNLIVRMNQGWILASVVERVERIRDFQNFDLVNEYILNVVSIRAVNSDKYVAKSDLFSRFSGHELSEGTSMSLGIVADGYISFGVTGALIFSFFWGFLVSIIFKIFDVFIKSSEIYYYFILIVLFYIIRPDTQVALALNHVVKSLVVVSAIYFYHISLMNRRLKHN